MKKLIHWIGQALTLGATWVSHISLRGLVVILGLALAFTAPQHDQLRFVDNALLQANSVFFTPPLGSSDIAIIGVPREAIATWQSDIHSSGTLAALLSNILNSPDAVVGLVVQQPIDTGAGAADTLIESLLAQSKSSTTRQNAKILVDRKYLLTDYLRNPRVVVGVEDFFFNGQKPLLRETVSFGEFQSMIEALVMPPCNRCFVQEHSVLVARPEVPQFSVLPVAWPERQLVFSSQFGDAYGGFLFQIIRALNSVSDDENFIWRQSEGLISNQLGIPLSLDGTLIPVHSLSERLAPIVDNISLEEALARGAFPRVNIIVVDGSELAKDLAAAIYSVNQEAVLFTPWWGSFALMALILFVTLYLSLVVTRISLRKASWITLIFALVILSAQSATAVMQGFWLPVALPVVWLLLGHFLLVVWSIKKRRLQNLIDRADNICIENAKQLLIRRDLDEAVVQLKDCSTREPLLQTLYDISEAYTEQKRYGQAVDVLKTIHGKNKTFKDTEQKLQVLQTMLKTATDQGDNLDKTKVVRAGRMPGKIGRYQLDREIGRGAMGKVYLGFDPRISRRVAIKTLSYEQFRGKERDEIKARFFREAEAAGRLNHPSIVSVYDVGEQRDLAFIAMDFAEGKALNHFVTPKNLLPIFEVYRIVCDVAIALEYAHENNIVHRDVKPSNIIYNPSPYQIKVTDFGIARLVDSSKTNTGEILGSPLYMAPEQLKGKKVNRSADIFSLGVTFYQLLTGHLPYKGENLAALTYEIIHGRHKPVRSLRKELPLSASRIVNQALQKDPEDRYETAAEMAMVLKKAIRRDFASAAKRAGYI